MIWNEILKDVKFKWATKHPNPIKSLVIVFNEIITICIFVLVDCNYQHKNNVQVHLDMSKLLAKLPQKSVIRPIIISHAKKYI